MRIPMLFTCVAVLAGLMGLRGQAVARNGVADGYQGIWYFNQPSNDQYVYKYSGGFATYPQQQGPIAIYAEKVRKTFFVYGGVDASKPKELLHMVSYYDHRTGTVPRPAILLNKQTEDAHDNPVLSIDEEGHLWVFSNSHGTSRPSYIHRSRKPYDIRDFELVKETNFSYAHIFRQPGAGFTLLHTRYEKGVRAMYTATSDETGRQWSSPELLARIELGQYQIAAQHSDGRLATVFDMHPNPGGLNARTNIYYLETADRGKTWRNVKGEAVEAPVRSAANPGLVHDYRAEGWRVYLKDLAFDRAGRPVILYLLTKGFESGPANGPRRWHTARWTGTEWQIRPFTTSDHNYDHGALWINRKDGSWQVIAPTAPGPQAYTTGGDMVLWRSVDQGATWKQVRQLTQSKHWNHTYAKRPMDAQPDFYALWADGDTLRPSGSNLYFTNKNGTAVFRLPGRMAGETARPERVR